LHSNSDGRILEANLSETLSVNCKFHRDSTPILCDKTQNLSTENLAFKYKKEK